MKKAARAIIIEGDKCLVMHRNKSGNQYFTLVGGRLNDDETPEQAVVREVYEETGLRVTAAKLVFIENHNDEVYNDQYIFFCNIAPHEDIAIQTFSEEGFMNKLGINIHTPVWAEISSFDKLPFRTPTLQREITKALKSGFPASPVTL